MIPLQELRRQIVHILLGLILALCVGFGFGDVILVLLLGSIILSFLLQKNIQIPLLNSIVALVERNNETEGIRIRGFIYYMLGVTFVVEVFAPNIAISAILILALGDSFQRLFLPFGKTKHPFSNKRFIESALIAGIIALGAILQFVPWWHGLIAVIVAMLIEAKDMNISWFKIDDNFLIPVISAFILFGLTFL